ncbi:U-box domain-containing protein 19 [Morus notabilis]|uniref:RING-type E3 ubiquitin transferase n=1 Tax=Morus notabilis TaxID=981085 RepID=W9RQ91_9ROSA|nr:U-box domain-containing protein 19 [Morus notabilis]EXB87865.1 U-box domain-containing protein 19 [Morus notabilis]
MIQISQRTDRRILTFPAVHPCEGISPATLLASLISLCGEICDFQCRHFPTQRRNAREAIRQVSLLLVFFEEVRDRCHGGSSLSDSAVLCFSELHVALQKLRFLLEDCARDGSRLWILTRCSFVAAQFRVLIRAIATALDVLPLRSIDVGGEVRELVELVARQARKAKFELDGDDERCADQVLAIISRLEKGIEPELNSLKRILDYLEIGTWSDCNKDVKFLEVEIDFQCSDCNEREVPFLSGLLGLMSYCRGVIFEEFDCRNSAQVEFSRCSVEALSCLNLEDFRCPISLELMTDPVTVSTGQTYDRSSIQKWLKAGNSICPKTGEKLINKELVPNSALRKLIHQFCEDSGISLSKSGRQSRDVTRTMVPGSLAAAEAMKFLSTFLVRKLVFGTNEQRNKAAYEIRLLAKSNIFNRSCFIDAGAVLPLLNLLSAPMTQENAAAALLKLSKHGNGRILIVESGGLEPILDVLKNGLSLEAKQISAAIIFYLSAVKEYQKLIGETPDLIPALIRLIRDGTSCGKKNAVVAIFGLLFFPNNQQRVIEAGTIPLLIDILNHSDKTELITDTLAVLVNLAENSDGANLIFRTPALNLIKNILQSSNSRAAKEYCVSILLSLCNNGGVQVVGVLANDPSVMALLYSVITDGTSLAGKKSRSLIKILHKYRETSSSGLTGTAVSHEQSVHAW